MAALGPYCSSLGITDHNIVNGQLPVCDILNIGAVLELKKYCDENNRTVKQLLNLLSEISPSFRNVNNPSAVISKLNSVKEQKKKLTSKKKVKGVRNVSELLCKQFFAPVNKIPSDTGGTLLPVSPPVAATEEKGIAAETTTTFDTKSVQTDSCEQDTSDTKHLNVLQHKIAVFERKVRHLSSVVNQKEEQLNSFKSAVGHYSTKNVNKRDNTARNNLHKLRDAQRKLLQHEKVREAWETEKKELSQLKSQNADLIDKVETLYESLETEKAKKVALQKANSYLRSEIGSLRAQVQDVCDCGEPPTDYYENIETIQRIKLEIQDRETIILGLQEEITDLKEDEIQTKDSSGTYNDNVRLCIMELAGLEVASEKMSHVISAVVKHLLGKQLKRTELPNATSCQSIVDEGQFVAKSYIAEKLENANNWGICRDGTTRKKQKIVDTSLTLDTGDVISQGFTRVARETAETINNVTVQQLTELSTLSESSEYLVQTLSRLAFTMSDRAANEKLADTLLDEWRDNMLQNYKGDIQDVHHFHCMAHVLLGLHNYINPEIKSFEQKLKEENGPLGRDTLSVFNLWSKKESVIRRVIRTTSETFGPAGDHLGMRDRWEAYCMENGIKSLIGNYRDNRFNALFQTAAEAFLHRDDFIAVLQTADKPNLKLTAVLSDLESQQITGLLQCLGLFYLKLTGPYWNMMTCGKVKYLELHRHIQQIEAFLLQCSSSPEFLLKEDQHWSENDPLGISRVPHHNRLAQALFCLQEDTRALVLQVTPVVSEAMMKCIRKQLSDFLPGGQYDGTAERDIATDFAPLTNLSCEHHFGDLDSSQKRRPNASFHHYSSVQLLKRNRNQMMNWLEKMDSEEKSKLLCLARQGGKEMRKKHAQQERLVMQDIHTIMTTEKEKKGKKRRKNGKEKPGKKQKAQPSSTEDIRFQVNEYVAVAYQDSWYPGIVETVHEDETALVNFMVPCKKKGVFQWPCRKDTQTVDKMFVVHANFIPDCVNSGRQWFVKEHEHIETLYARFYAEFLS